MLASVKVTPLMTVDLVTSVVDHKKAAGEVEEAQIHRMGEAERSLHSRPSGTASSKAMQ